MIDNNTEPIKSLPLPFLTLKGLEINHSKNCICGDYVSKSGDIQTKHFNDDQISQEYHNSKTNKEGSVDTFYFSEDNIKSSYSASEMTIVKEINVKGITNENYDLDDFHNLNKDHILDFENSTQLSSSEYYPSVNLLNENILVSSNYFNDIIKIDSNESNNIKTPGTGIDLSISSLEINNSSDGTVDSEEDSSTSSGSLESPESSSMERNRNTLINKPTSTTNIHKHSLLKPVNSKLSRVINHIADLDDIDRQLSLIDQEIKSLPPTNKFDWTEFHIGSAMDKEMTRKFEGLQRNISSFLERTAVFENPVNDLLDSDKSEGSRGTSSPHPHGETEILSNRNLDMKENSNKGLQFPYNIRGKILNSFELFPSLCDDPNSKDCSPIHSLTECNDSRNSIISLKDDSNVPDNLGVLKDLNSQSFIETDHQVSEIELTDNLADNLDSRIIFSERPEKSIHEETVKLDIPKPRDEEIVVQDYDFEGGTIISDKIANIESKESVDYQKHLNHRTYREVIEREKGKCYTPVDNEPSRIFSAHKGNVKEAIRLFESKISNTKSISGK